jgi:hypothetical protein
MDIGLCLHVLYDKDKHADGMWVSTRAEILPIMIQGHVDQPLGYDKKVELRKHYESNKKTTQMIFRQQDENTG